MHGFLRNNSLTVVLFLLFALSLAGEAVAGWLAHGSELTQHGRGTIAFLDYLSTGHFISGTFENWESEFLQMALYVLLTAMLVQKGSPESRNPESGPAEQHEAEAEARRKPDAPWPLRRGGLVARLYAHSLSAALILLLAVSFWLHVVGSTRHANEQAAWHDAPAQTVADTLGDAEFWFESFQNWQSEFLSIAVFIVLGIYLRERGSPESKRLAAGHDETGR